MTTPAPRNQDVPTSAVSWEHLLASATAAAATAYVPYSRYRVGAAALTSSGAVVSGCNVENESYGLTLCAECGLISDLHRQTAGRCVRVVVVDAVGNAISPCGRCRQLILEHSEPTAEIMLATGPVPVSSLLPAAFDASALG